MQIVSIAAVARRQLTCLALLLVALVLLPLLMGGCASAKLDQTLTAGPLPKPDMIIVHNFATDLAEVQLDKGLMATTLRNASDATQSQEEAKVGHIVADKLAQKLVDELQKSGINAVRASGSVQPSNRTLILQGQFININQGDQSQRVWIGFGLGGTKLCTHIEAIQNGQLVAQADTSTKSGLKPGMAVSAGVAVASGGVAPVVVGAAAAGTSETFFATVEADATRTAKAVAKRIKNAYIARGWLAE